MLLKLFTAVVHLCWNMATLYGDQHLFLDQRKIEKIMESHLRTS